MEEDSGSESVGGYTGRIDRGGRQDFVGYGVLEHTWLTVPNGSVSAIVSSRSSMAFGRRDHGQLQYEDKKHKAPLRRR